MRKRFHARGRWPAFGITDGKDDAVGEIPKRWPMRRPMLEMVSAVVSLKPPEGFNGKGDKGDASSLTLSTVCSKFSLLCHEQSVALDFSVYTCINYCCCFDFTEDRGVRRYFWMGGG